MGFSDREGITADGEAMRRQELEAHGDCPLCEGRGMVAGPGILMREDVICPDCDGSGLAGEVTPPAADGRAT